MIATDFTNIADQVIDGYGVDDNQHGFSVPNECDVQRLADSFLAFQSAHPASKHARSYVIGLLSRFHDALVECVDQSKLARQQAGAEGASAEEVLQAVIDDLPRLRGKAKLDAEAMYEADPSLRDRRDVWTTPGIKAITLYRVANRLELLGVPCLPRMITEYAHERWGIDIHPGATIGNSFCIDHGTGTTVGETTHIGNHVRLYQNVTLGALTFPRDGNGELLRGPGVKRHPTLQDYVVVYASASILGGKTVVGRGTVIGSNVRLTESVEAQMFVRVDKPNFRIDPYRPFGPWPPRPTSVAEAYLDRLAISSMIGDGCPNCRDADELEWPQI